VVPLNAADILRQTAARLGLEAFGIAPARAPAHSEDLHAWLSRSFQAEMTWMERDPETRADPHRYDPTARTILVAGVSSRQTAPPFRRGRIAAYAQGADYHDFLREKLETLARETLTAWQGSHRICVDSSPLLEKPLAALAGIGWQGKNTLLIHREHGPWLLLGFLLTDLVIPADAPDSDHCGTCTRCLDACPTQAFPKPYVLDARRCLAYLTIEHPGAIPEEFRPLVGDRLFGCDECLEVCPWNRHAQNAREIKLTPRPRPDLRDMLAWDDARFRSEFRGTPVFRLKRNRWLRNVSVVLGNIGDASDLPVLEKASQDEDALVREHAAWAVNRIRNRISGGA
jgi:epoxyqueuosine reductase